MKKTVISILLALALCASMLPAVVSADGGEFIFNAETGTITGYTDPNVTELEIPETINGVTVKKIGEGAFNNFRFLTKVSFPESLTTIEQAAFSFCTSIVTVTIPKNVNVIGIWAFGMCSSLSEINITENNSTYTSIDGVVYTKDMRTLVCYPGGKTGSFSVPEGVTVIEDGAYAGCTGLTNVMIPGSTIFLGEGTFALCTGLTVLSIPESIAIIGNAAFAGCTSLTAINIAENNSTYSSVDGVVYTKDMKTLVCYPGGKSGLFSIPESVALLGDYSFAGCSSLESVTIPEGVTTVGNSAFSGCKSLTDVTIPKSMKRIEKGAFENCDNLKDVYYSGTEAEWTNIDIVKNGGYYFLDGNYDLRNATKHFTTESQELEYDKFIFDAETGTIKGYTDRDVTELVIPAEIDGVAVKEIGRQAFFEFSSLECVTISDGVTTFCFSAFCGCESLTDVTIPHSVTTIGESAFNRCKSLVNVKIPESVETIDSRAFSNCTSLTEITVAEGNNSYISIDGVLYTKDMETLVFYPGGRNGEFVIPDSVTTIGRGAFEGCERLTNVTIPDGVKTIGICAFSKCASLKSVEIPKGVERIESWVFQDCISLTSAKIPKSVTLIGYYAFSNCESLKSISIPEGVTFIGMFAFSNCTSLTSVTVPSSMRRIESGTFDGCESLTSVDIPKSVKRIEYHAFADCNKLSNVFYSGTEEEWKDVLISDNNNPLTNATIFFHSDKDNSDSSPKTEGVLIAAACFVLTIGITILIIAFVPKKKKKKKEDIKEETSAALTAVFCQYCGAKRMNGAKFCTLCGQKIGK